MKTKAMTHSRTAPAFKCSDLVFKIPKAVDVWLMPLRNQCLGGEILTDCERNLDQDEKELYPERGAQDAVLSIVNAEALELGADEDGGNQIPHAVAGSCQ